MLLDHFLFLLEKNEWNADYSDTVIKGLLELCIPEKLAERVTQEFEYNRCIELMTYPEIEFWDKLASKLNIKLKSLEAYRPLLNQHSND